MPLEFEFLGYRFPAHSGGMGTKMLLNLGLFKIRAINVDPGRKSKPLWTESEGPTTHETKRRRRSQSPKAGPASKPLWSESNKDR
ncbi:MAG: hypothetical protein ACI8T1_001706 [Verrucomicrobiales bacterium]|jgi:hypothetical protein